MPFLYPFSISYSLDHPIIYAPFLLLLLYLCNNDEQNYIFCLTQCTLVPYRIAFDSLLPESTASPHPGFSRFLDPVLCQVSYFRQPRTSLRSQCLPHV